MADTKPAQDGRKVRYAVVGLGHIAQAAVLPAFRHAAENSELTALVSSDPVKLKKLGAKYKVTRRHSYDEYDQCLAGGDVDAVYIALPNDQHKEYAVRAAKAGIHVLCEKPMAVTEADCREMIQAAGDRVRLMIAYRLHFEEANLKAAEIAQSGRIGEPRFFSSEFCMQVREKDIRVDAERGGGTLYDIGIYCINAARSLFQGEPIEVAAFSVQGQDERFAEVDEMSAAILRFPGDRLATFTSSFGAADVSSYRIVGTKGDLRVEPAYEYAAGLAHRLTVDGKTTKQKFPKRDQFAPELIYFSQCVIDGKKPEPSGEEGLMDVRIIEALYRSARSGRPEKLPRPVPDEYPTLDQEIRKPAVKKPELVHSQSPSL